MKKPTIFIDIDGTILEHRHNEIEIYELPEAQPTPNAVEKFNEWQNKGYYVVVISARPDTAKMWLHTTNHLQKFGFRYNRILLGITSGVRYMINDEKPTVKKTAFGITVPRDKGLGDLDI